MTRGELCNAIHSISGTSELCEELKRIASDFQGIDTYSPDYNGNGKYLASKITMLYMRCSATEIEVSEVFKEMNVSVKHVSTHDDHTLIWI
ncbi:MAG: hypothetical protein HFJ26_01120 [Clostridia bacterium]|nr:hypothetical protein [Clostridia bacterium]